jgi:hypothetical protein
MHKPLLLAFAALGLLALPGFAAARAPAPTIKNGYYADLVGVRSSEVTFHVRRHNRIPDLALVCAPTNAAYQTTTIDIAVHVPALHINSGRFTYHGTATITASYGGAPRLGTTTLTISAHHVNGPVHHYVFEGNHLSETTAWKGKVSSPACNALPKHGGLTLFGPVPGE